MDYMDYMEIIIMENYKKFLVGASFALVTTFSIATSCPQVGNYQLTSHSRNNQTCTYTSYGTGSLGLLGTRATQNCPRFILTDPNFQQATQCRVVLRTASPRLNNQEANAGARCKCTIRAQR